MVIIKRNGLEAEFDSEKIKNAISKAAYDPNNYRDDPLNDYEIDHLTNRIVAKCQGFDRTLSVEEIQDIVEDTLIEYHHPKLAKSYIKYRYQRYLIRESNSVDDNILTLVDSKNEEVKQENSNKNTTIISTQRDYIAGEISKDISSRLLIPKYIMDAHNAGLIHFHDMDYFIQRCHNCCLINLEDMLQNGTVISKTKIEKPHSFLTACNVATQIIAQVASNQYGGQSVTLTHLAPFVDISRQKIREQVIEEFSTFNPTANPNDEESAQLINDVVESRLKKEIKQGIQTIQYQILTLMTTNGQTPFVTIFMYLGETDDKQTKSDLALIIEETLNQRIIGTKNEVGHYVTPAFPKLIYVLEEDNIHEDSPYYYLTTLAAKCTAKRLVPDYISEKKMKELKVDENGVGHCYPVMGCRSALTPYLDEKGKPKYYGRFNVGVVTINLVDVACSSHKDMDVFWAIMDVRLAICYDALILRHKRLRGTLSDSSPIHWQDGALSRLKKGEPIDKLLYNGYSTLSLGYAGLCECVRYMTGHSHTEPEGKEFGLQVMKYLNDACARWRKATTIAFSLYGTPIESTTYKFAKCLQNRFGKIEGVTDKNYITNSYHVHVTEKIDAFTKIKLEAEFQALSPGGAISYVEVPNMQHNIPAVIAVMRYIYDNILYAELNTKSDFCQKCNYDGEIMIVKDKNDKLVWECPNCGNRDQNTMNVARRTCGYIGSQFWNQGRTQEIAERELHL